MGKSRTASNSRDVTLRAEQSGKFCFDGGLHKRSFARSEGQSVEHQPLNVNGDVHPTASSGKRSGLGVLPLPTVAFGMLVMAALDEEKPLPKANAEADVEAPAAAAAASGAGMGASAATGAAVAAAGSCQRKSDSLIGRSSFLSSMRAASSAFCIVTGVFACAARNAAFKAML